MSEVGWIGPYRVVERLGAGGMGEVFLGRSPAGRAVAVKMVKRAFADDERFRARFEREVEAARAVSGAFTAAVVDADPAAPQPWLATSFLPGPSLQEAVAEHGPMPAEAVLALAAGLAEALASIHAAGIAHRDLKPSNVILAPDGPRVIDFGIAHAAEGTRVTRTGQVIGSPGFMSPEQAAGGETGPAGDVFSLGAILVYVATGSSPFGKGPPQVQIYRNAREEPRLDEVADPRVRDLAAACMARDPSARPAPGELLRRLSSRPEGTAWLPAAVAADVASRTRVGEARSRRRLGLAAAVVAAVVLLSVGGAVARHFLSGEGSGGCGATCPEYESERAFAAQWTPKLESLHDCPATRTCAQGAIVATQLRQAIAQRPDAGRYSGVLAHLTELSNETGAYALCQSMPPAAADGAPSCALTETNIVGIAGTLQSDLVDVASHTLNGS